MAAVLHHALLGLSVAALAAAGLRVASLAAPSGLERGLAAAALAAAAAVGEALGLGLGGLGGSTAALTLAAAATWILARTLLPPPAVRAGGELAAWWRGLRMPERTALGAIAGAGAAWTVWLVRYPALGHDMVLYHVPEAIGWVHNGHPGAIDGIVIALPVGNYPLTYEVLNEWAIAIARSLVPVTLIVPAAVLLVMTAGWCGLRRLCVPRAYAALAVGALVAEPAVLASQSGGASLDPAALGWLLCCAALCAGCGERPALLAPALVAGGLAVGTKTTTAPLTALVLILGVYSARCELRRLSLPLGLAAGLSLVVGATWYIRNLVLHGSPAWPFVAAPWGDPQPRVYAQADFTFLDRAGETLRRLHGYYLRHFGGAIALLAGALVAGVVARRRAVVAGAVVTAASVLVWMNAPLTGVLPQTAFDLGVGDATRYLLPAVAVAGVTLALATKAPGRPRFFAAAVLAAALGIGTYETFHLGFPSAPAVRTPLAGAAVGAALAALAGRATRDLRLPRALDGRAIGVAAAVGLGMLSAAAASGYVARHGRTGGAEDAGLASWFASQPRWRSGSDPIAISGALIGPLAGDRLQHPLDLLDQRAGCTGLEASRAGWAVIDLSGISGATGLVRCLGSERPVYADLRYRVYTPPGARARTAMRSRKSGVTSRSARPSRVAAPTSARASGGE